MGEGKKELLEKIPMLNSNRRAKNYMEAWPRIVQFELEGEEAPFFIVIEGGRIELKEGRHQKPNINIQGDAEEFGAVVRGEKDITHPLLFGKIWLSSGKNTEMITFSRILSSVTRKWGE